MRRANARAQTRVAVVPGGQLTSRYLVQRTPTHKHRGIDIGAAAGTPVRAMDDGVIAGLYPDCMRRGYGNSLLVQHMDGTYAFYAHLEGFAVAEDERVRKGQTIGYVGSTECGAVTSRRMWPHLHLEVHTEMVLPSNNPGGRPVIKEEVPRRVDPLWYIQQVGMKAGGDDVV